MMDIGFLNPWAFYGFAVLIPVIILYLLKPRPRDIKVPSLMFIIAVEHRRRFRSLFRRLFRDPLLLLQLLLLSLLVLALAGPFTLVYETHHVREDIAVVIDSSASMMARDVSPSRFFKAVDTAKSIVADMHPDDKVTLILAENIPIVLANRDQRDRALRILNSLTPKATPTGIGNSVLLARDMIKDSEVEKTIYILSDFSHYQGMDPVAAAKNAFAEGISVVPIKISGEGENIGIISARGGRKTGDCFAEAIVKNYGGTERSATMQFEVGGQPAGSDSKNIGPGGTVLFSFMATCSPAEHTLTLSIDAGDALSQDNSAWFVVPEQKRFRVLLIKESSSADYIKYALESLPNVELDIAIPTVMPSLEGYDVVIFQSAERGTVLPGTFKIIGDFVSLGGNAVIIGSEELLGMDPDYLPGFLPVLPGNFQDRPASPEILFDHQIIRDIELDSLAFDGFLKAYDKKGTLTLARADNSSLLSYWDLGEGGVLYFGIGPDATWGGFHLRPSFPVFWSQTLDWLGREETVSLLNFKTGEQLPVLVNQTLRVEKPSGEVLETRSVLLDETGVYKILPFDKRVAANLMDEEESDIQTIGEAEALELESGYTPTSQDIEVKQEFFWLLALAVLALALIEWFYYKGRGTL